MMPPSRSNRQKAERLGLIGEMVAEILLRLTFHRILARRLKTPVGEIDLVACRGKSLVFVEIKTRRRKEDAAQALAAVNQRRIDRAGQYFVSRHPEWAARPTRFDVIFLAPFAWPRHVKGAFESRV